MTGPASSPVFCAIDTDDLEHARKLATALAHVTGSIKLGLQFFNAHGPQGVKTIMDDNPDLPLFLDLKYHDIPNTVAQAVRAVVPLGCTYINVHASGGLDMMKAAKNAAATEAEKRGMKAPKVLGVTILTSLDEDGIGQSGFLPDLNARVIQLAQLAQKAGLDGVVCSAYEIKAVREACGDDFVLMVPGIRPADYSTTDDQRRTMTPQAALKAGATHLVIGRPITQDNDPAAAARKIMEDIRASS